MAPKNVLVVDDDPDFSELVRLLLEDDSGVRVVSAREGNDALVKARQTSPALVILDVKLPGLDGWEVARKLKSDATTRSIPIMMVTACRTTYQEVRRAGADDFIEKPFDLDSFIRKVAYHLSVVEGERIGS